MTTIARKNYGLILNPIEEDHYLLGAVAPTILQPTGNWQEFLPAVELQSHENLETYNCTVYGTLNAIEVLMGRLFWSPQDRAPFNFSERYVGVLSETTPQGNDPHKVAETIRKISGLIPENMLPFDESIQTREQYFSPKPMKPLYLRIGEKWLKTYEFAHEWVPTDATSLRKALQVSPLGVAVNAWDCDEKTGLYINNSPAANHWTLLYNSAEGQYWDIFDTYDNTHKRLAWNYQFARAKVYHLNKLPEQSPSLCGRVKNYFETLL